MQAKESDRKAALVTGGAQGIGRAIARRILRDGMRVAILDADEDQVTEAIERTVSGFGSLDVRRVMPLRG